MTGVPPAAQPYTVWRLLRVLARHALQGRGSDTVDMVVNRRRPDGVVEAVTGEVSDFTWQDDREAFCAVEGWADSLTPTPGGQP